MRKKIRKKRELMRRASGLLAAVMLITAVPATAWAEQNDEVLGGTASLTKQALKASWSDALTSPSDTKKNQRNDKEEKEETSITTSSNWPIASQSDTDPEDPNDLYEILLENDRLVQPELQLMQENLAVQPMLLTARKMEGIAVDQENFPDEKFRAWVKYVDANEDKILSDGERNGVKQIHVEKATDWTSLKGIEHFPNLETLTCSWGPLKGEVNLSHNTALTSVELNNNQISSLDISELKNLKYLNVFDNKLESLNVSDNTELHTLNAAKNRLKTLDLSSNTELKQIEEGLNHNRLESLTLPNNGMTVDLTKMQDQTENKTGYRSQVIWTDQSGTKLESVTAQGQTLNTKQVPIEYSVIYYDSQDAAVHSDPETYTYEDSFTLKSAPEARKGYQFQGWSTSRSGGKKYDAGASVTKLTSSDYATVPLYGVWKGNSYTIQFNAGTVPSGLTVSGSMEAQMMEYGKKQSLNKFAFTVSDSSYQFVGWSASPDSNDVLYGDGAMVSNLTEDENGTVTLYAQWREKPTFYHVEFKDGTGTYSTVQVLKGSKVSAPAVDTEVGRQFEGWFEDSDFKTQYDFSEPVNGNLTIYGKWSSETYTLSFHSVIDGKTDLTRNYSVLLGQTFRDSKQTVPGANWYGHRLAGWYFLENGQEKIFDPDAVVTGNMELYTKWEELPRYKLEFVADQTVIHTESMPEGTPIGSGNVAYDPSKDGYRFTGWYWDLNGTKPLKLGSDSIRADSKLYAGWELVSGGQESLGNNGTSGNTGNTGNAENSGTAEHNGNTGNFENNGNTGSTTETGKKPGQTPAPNTSQGSTGNHSSTGGGSSSGGRGSSGGGGSSSGGGGGGGGSRSVSSAGASAVTSAVVGPGITPVGQNTSVPTVHSTPLAGTWTLTGDKWTFQAEQIGSLANAWATIGESWYLFDEQGYMRTGWYDSPDGKRYYMETSGAMQTGWKEIEGKWYYFQSDGSMAKDTVVDGRRIDEQGNAQ